MSYAIIGFGSIGQALARAFARNNIEVAVASRRSPEALLPQAQAIGPKVIPKTLAEALKADVIILDMNLPSADGLKACQQLTRLNPRLKIIVFTAGHDPGLRQRALDAGAAAFVDKLAHNGELLSAVEALRPGSDLPARG
jgi:predicted dinucleotide-binding enzyme